MNRPTVYIPMLLGILGVTIFVSGISFRARGDVRPEVRRNPYLVHIAKATMAKRLPGVSFADLSQFSMLTTPDGKVCVMGLAYLDGQPIAWNVILDGERPVSIKIGGAEPEAVP